MTLIKGTWYYPSLSRCDKEAAYSDIKMAESEARAASERAGQLIIAYK
jgi:hypothetical protein